MNMQSIVRRKNEMSMNIDKCQERYQNDAVFHTMVEIFYKMIFDNELTVSELRDALTFAGIKLEMENMRREYYNKC